MSRITNNIEQVLEELLSGKPVALPTETVYGLAANSQNEQAIRAVFAMKQRPLNHPLIMHIAKEWDLEQWVMDVPSYAKEWMKHVWPGPLTLVLKAKPNCVSPLITGGQTTVALRCPNHPLFLEVLKAIQSPLVAPSANAFGKISPTTAEHVRAGFLQEDLMVFDGGRCTVGIESTIVDATAQDSYQILRAGVITEDVLEKYAALASKHQETAIRVPGKLENHYQPEKKLYCFEEVAALEAFCKEHKDVFVIANSCPDSVPETYYYQWPKSSNEAAFELYYQIRKADNSSASCIAVELPKESHAWAGIRERVLKAGSK